MYAVSHASLRRVRSIASIPAAAMTAPRASVIAAHSAWMAARVEGAAKWAATINAPIFFSDADRARIMAA